MKNKELKKLAYELRQDTVDIIMAGAAVISAAICLLWKFWWNFTLIR